MACLYEENYYEEEIIKIQDEEPIEEISKVSTKKSTKALIDESDNESINESINESDNKSINESDNESDKEPNKKSVILELNKTIQPYLTYKWNVIKMKENWLLCIINCQNVVIKYNKRVWREHLQQKF